MGQQVTNSQLMAKLEELEKKVDGIHTEASKNFSALWDVIKRTGEALRRESWIFPRQCHPGCPIATHPVALSLRNGFRGTGAGFELYQTENLKFNA